MNITVHIIIIIAHTYNHYNDNTINNNDNHNEDNK